MHSPEEQLFEQALELPPGSDRADFLRTACHGDLKLELRVGQLLAAHESPSSLLDAPVVDPLLQLLSAPISDACGESIGPYKLLELIGEGGMGLVYMAEQEHPVRRRVALKIIKPGMDTRQVIARFEAERRALERLDHPGIARVLDAGITPAGRPYFVMELVRGISITEFCDQSQLDTRARLELFIRVCQAVQHAHDAGIIHRDLKPANILVTLHDGVPVPKIIDFGIAKATSGRLVDQTLFTNFLQMIGTPVYMSPEQAQLTSQDVDQRSDVYSLGVVLYELLTGTTPFTLERLRSVGVHEAQRIISNEEPPTPSGRIATLSGDEMSTVAARRNVDARRYGHSLRGDLDWIAMRALEKDRRRRYQSAAELVADVRRYQRHRPVQARRPTAFYRLQRFATRRRGALIAAALLLATAGIAFSAVALVRRADNERLELAAVHEREVDARQESVRQFRYVADIQRAQQLLERGRLQETRSLLAQHRPAVGESELRGFEWHYLWNRCQLEPWVIRDRPYHVFDVSWSPSGKYMATATAEGSLSVRDGATGEAIQSIDGFSQDVNAVTFSADESLVAVAEETYAASFWDWRSKQQIARIDGFRNSVARVFLTADPDLALITDCAWGSDAANTTLCRISTREWIRQWPDYRALAVDVIGNRMLLRNSDMRLELRSFSDLETAIPLNSTARNFESASFSPDGRLLVVGRGDGLVELWQTGELIRQTFEFQLATHGRDVAISPDGTLCAACGDDGVVHVWDTQTFQKHCCLWTDAGRAWNCTFSNDGSLLGVTLSRGIVNLYETSSLRPASRVAATLPADTRAWALDHSGRQLASALSETREVVILDPSTGGTSHRFPMRPDESVGTLAFAPDDMSLWIGSETGAVREIDISTSLEKRRLTVAPGRHDLIVSPDEMVIGTVPDMTFWDTTTGARLLTIPESRPDMAPRIFGFFDEQTVITQILAREGFELWNVRDARRLETRFEHAPVGTVAVSPDKSLLAVGTNEPAIHLWETADRRDRHVLVGHIGLPRNLAFSPDGQTLASSSGRDLRLWNVATGQFLFHRNLCVNPEQMAFSSDGQRLVIVGPIQPDGRLGVVVLDAPTNGASMAK